MVYLGTPQPEYLDWSKELDLFGSDHHTEDPLLCRKKLDFPDPGWTNKGKEVTSVGMSKSLSLHY